MFLRVPGLRIRRTFWLLIGGMVLGPVTGCTGFQSIASESWLEGRWLQGEAEQQVSHVFTIWDGNVRTAQDTANSGATLHGLVGRLLLLNDDTGKGMDAHGTVMVCMHDVTDVAAGKEPIRIAEWKFDTQSLKPLKKRDRFGDGYTLFLPWDAYHSGVKQVHLQVCYVTEKGTRHYAEPLNLTLQTDELQRSMLQSQTVPIAKQAASPGTPAASQLQAQAENGGRQQPASTPGTRVQYLPVAPEPPMVPAPLPPR
jgi:hypothetical protein